MKRISFADVVHQSITFRSEDPAERLILELIDNRWMQRLRDVAQTANTRLVYMFSEHSRFGHCLGAAYLAARLTERLAQDYPQVSEYRSAVVAAALLHDIGHLAPGSHVAQKVWFPAENDVHEQTSIKILTEDQELSGILDAHKQGLSQTIAKILSESTELPPWTWEIISGGGWNVDRGNWCIVDSVLAGVAYGHYNIPALTDSILISPDQHLALHENRLDAMLHFAISRHAMYRQIYQHRVLLAADCLIRAIVERARDLGPQLEFADAVMQRVLDSKTAEQLRLDDIFLMREPWWRYHILNWQRSRDSILADLSQRLINRRLLKTVRINPDEDASKLIDLASQAVQDCGYNPKYYLHTVSTKDVYTEDLKQSMLAIMDNGKSQSLAKADPLVNVLSSAEQQQRQWLVMPAEAKVKLGRNR